MFIYWSWAPGSYSGPPRLKPKMTRYSPEGWDGVVKYMLYKCIISGRCITHILVGVAHVVLAATGGVKVWAGLFMTGLHKLKILAHVAGKGIALEWVALIATPIGLPCGSLHQAGFRTVNHDPMFGSHVISPHQWKEQIYSPFFALFHRWIGGYTCGILHLGGASTTLGFFFFSFSCLFFVKACIELVMGQSPKRDSFS